MYSRNQVLNVNEWWPFVRLVRFTEMLKYTIHFKVFSTVWAEAVTGESITGCLGDAVHPS
jgi:hypothetical protein